MVGVLLESRSILEASYMTRTFEHNLNMPNNNSHPRRIVTKRSLRKKWSNPLLVYVDLIRAALRDAASACNQSDVDLERDLDVVEARVQAEGVGFLTVTLPLLGKALDRALANSIPLEIVGWKTDDHGIPLFLGYLWRSIFDSERCERSDASALALRWLRQLLYLFYKLELPPTEEQVAEVIQRFKTTDTDLARYVQAADPRHNWITKMARRIICSILAPIHPRDPENFRPRHGPGAVATGEKGWEKVTFKRWYRRLAKYFPYEDYFHYNLTHLCDDLSVYLNLPEMEHGTAKVVLVPKDSRGPRLISCEPLEYQWIQQGLRRVLEKAIVRHPLSSGQVNFVDQTINQRLALTSSLDGRLVTLDMKDASDRVSLELVRVLFPSEWFDALYACRSPDTMLPDGEVFPMNKFAPMGSAVCFPVESLVFWALSVAAIMYNNPSIKRREASKLVYVYGDDLICRSEDQAAIRLHLERVGLQFNSSKCCVGRFFRESCGVDAYNGVNVTPLRLKATWDSLPTASGLMSYVAFHNAAADKGLFHLTDSIAEKIKLFYAIPYSESSDVGYLSLVDCRKTPNIENVKFKKRYNRRLQRLEIFSLVGSTPRYTRNTPGWSEMQRIASIGPSKDGTDTTAIQAVGRSACVSTQDIAVAMLNEDTATAYQYTLPRRVSLKRGWRPLV